MENKFGLKDFINIALLIAVIVSIWLAMFQFDRQHRDIRAISSSISELATQQAQLRSLLFDLNRQLEEGIALAPGASGSSGGRNAEHDPGAGPDPGAADAFERIRAAREHPEFAEGDGLIDAFASQVPRLNAVTATDTYSRRVYEYVLETLIRQDPDTLEYLPHLARSWHVDDRSEEYAAYEAEATQRFAAEAEADPSLYEQEMERLLSEVSDAPEPGSDAYAELEEQAIEDWIVQQIREDPDRPTAMVITYDLRRDVVFSDGTPFTAHDVVFTWELLNTPDIDNPARRNFYDVVETYEAPDDHTVVFGIREPHYLAFGMTGGLPIVPREYYSQFSVQEINENPGLLMGSGPYRLRTPDGWRPGDLIELVRNPNYWGPRPALDRLAWRIVTSDVARLTEYRNGEIDVFSANPEQYEQLLEDEETAERSHALAYDTIPSGYSYIAWNQRRRGEATPFADKRVRQAMTYLTPRQRIAEDVMLGYATVADGPFPADSPQAAPELEPRPHDVEKAMELLREAGWERDASGALRDGDGNRFRFELTYPSGSDVYDQIVLALRDAYARAGIVLDLNRTEWSVFRDRLNNRRFDAITLAWGGGAIEGDIRQMFHSSQIAGSADNFMSYSNPELDELIDRARRTIDEDERMALWQECHRILHEDQPYTFMLRRQTLWFVDGRVENIQYITTGINDREEWFVPSPAQKYSY